LSEKANCFTDNTIPFAKGLLVEISSFCGQIEVAASKLLNGIAVVEPYLSFVPLVNNIVGQAKIITAVVSVALNVTEFTADVLVDCCDKVQKSLSNIFCLVSKLSDKAISYLEGKQKVKAEEKEKEKGKNWAKSFAK